MDDGKNMADELDFESLVNQYYQPLYQFALSLSQTEADACDLTQQTFYIWQIKGQSLREREKVKTWLFTTMHREFLNSKRRYVRFPHLDMDQAENELPPAPEASLHRFDIGAVLDALGRIEETHRAAIALFYLEDYSYKEIADILAIPIGTVKSRLSRGISQLQLLLADRQQQYQEDAR
jgi:RNA polymerase sigma-70 factor (ECF subfamily)